MIKGMYCHRCGDYMSPDHAFCTNCGTKLAVLPPAGDEQTIALATPTAPNNDTSQPPPVHQPTSPTATLPARPPSTLRPDLGQAFKGVFSADPAGATVAAMGAQSPVWAVFGGIYAIVVAFSPFLLLTFAAAPVMNSISNAFWNLGVDGYGAISVDYLDDAINRIFPQLVVYSLLVGVASLLLWATGSHIFLHTRHTPVPYRQSLNLAAVSLIPATAGMLAAIILGIAWPPAALLSLAAGYLTSTLLTYQAAWRTSQPTKPGLWPWTLTWTGIILATMLCAYLLAALMFL